METVKLYKIKQTAAYRADEVGSGWSFRPYSGSPDYRGETIEEAMFELPEGFFVGGNDYTEIAIYDRAANTQASLFTASNGRPALAVGADKKIIRLRKLGEAPEAARDDEQ